MRLFAVIALGLFAFSSASKAETLSVTAIYPAGSDAAASVRSIAVENFGGSDGPALSLKLEDLLRDVFIERRAWFRVVPALGGADADAILRGNATADVRRDKITLTRKRCQAYDEKKKCTEYKDVEVDCLRRTVTLNYAIRLVRWQGELLYRYDGAPQQQRNHEALHRDGRQRHAGKKQVEMLLEQKRHHAQRHALHRDRRDQRGHAAGAEREQVDAHREADEEIQRRAHAAPPFHATSSANRQNRIAVVSSSGTRRNASRASRDSTSPTPIVTARLEKSRRCSGRERYSN